MLTKKQVINNHPEYKTLICAVYNRLNEDDIINVNIHGMKNGFSGFIYYHETYNFAIRFRKQINKLLDEYYTEYSYRDATYLIELINPFFQEKMNKDERRNLFAYLGYGKCISDRVTNTICWFAVEKVCTWFEE